MLQYSRLQLLTTATAAAQVYMDSIGDLLWEQDKAAGGGMSHVVSRPKLEVKNGAFGSHLPGLTEKQVQLHLHVTMRWVRVLWSLARCYCK